MKKTEYFSEDCIVEDELFRSLKSLLICPKCNKIYNNPMMCQNCQKIYCHKCIDNTDKKCLNNENHNFVKSLSKNELLSKIKYRCKNCSEIVIQSDIHSHLEKNCIYQEKIEKKLSETFLTKKKLLKLTSKEMETKNQNDITYFTSK